MAVNQAAKFSANPKSCHDTAVKRTGKYSLGTSDEGLTHKPDNDENLEACADADFAGGFNLTNAEDPASVYLQTGCVIKHTRCPIIWKSNLQTEIALSTTEVEHIALSAALRETIPTTQLLKEIGAVMDITPGTKTTKYTVFEDKNGAIELAKAPKMRPRTKNISIKYHHFRSCVHQGETIIGKNRHCRARS